MAIKMAEIELVPGLRIIRRRDASGTPVIAVGPYLTDYSGVPYRIEPVLPP